MRNAAVVTDTHPLLFHANRDRRLSRAAKAHFAACERREALTYVPMAVLWECSALASIGRIELRPSFREFFEDLFSNPAFQPVDLSFEQICPAHEQRSGSDPFDALICGAALFLGLPLLTKDSRIEQSGVVETLW